MNGQSSSVIDSTFAAHTAHIGLDLSGTKLDEPIERSLVARVRHLWLRLNLASLRLVLLFPERALSRPFRLTLLPVGVLRKLSFESLAPLPRRPLVPVFFFPLRRGIARLESLPSGLVRELVELRALRVPATLRSDGRVHALEHAV